MIEQPRHSRGYGAWFLAGVALLAAGVAAFNAFDWGNGIAYTGGAYLVLGSSCLLFFGALVLAVAAGVPRWLRTLLVILLLLDLAGTSLAGYFLEATVLVALMAVGLLAWLVLLIRDRPTVHQTLQHGLKP
jgi:hypothetical protein